MTTTNTQNKGKIPYHTVTETSKPKQRTKNLVLPAIVMAAAAICAASCNDSVGDEQESTEYKTEENVLRFTTDSDGTQRVVEEKVQANLPDPVIRNVERDQYGRRWIKIYHEAVPFSDGSIDSTGLLREYAYIDIDANTIMSKERYDAAHLETRPTGERVYWHAATPYSFDGFWSDKMEASKDEAMQIHQSSIDSFLISGHPSAVQAGHHGANGDWSTDSVATKPVQTHSGGHGGYIFARSYYPYAYHDYGSSPVAASPLVPTNKFANGVMKPANRFSTVNLFKAKALSMTQKIGPRSIHFNAKARTSTFRGGFRSRGVSFGS